MKVCVNFSHTHTHVYAGHLRCVCSRASIRQTVAFIVFFKVTSLLSWTHGHAPCHPRSMLPLRFTVSVCFQSCCVSRRVAALMSSAAGTWSLTRFLSADQNLNVLVPLVTKTSGDQRCNVEYWLMKAAADHELYDHSSRGKKSAVKISCFLRRRTDEEQRRLLTRLVRLTAETQLI